MSLYLTGPQIKLFVEALAKAYKPGGFENLLLGRLDKVLEELSMKDNYIDILYDVVDVANREGWPFQLLDAARASNPNNPQLLSLEASLGFGPIPATNTNNNSLEKIVSDRSGFQNLDGFLRRLGQFQTWVCAIEMPGGGGTGFLVGPDLILTNYHVVESFITGAISSKDARCRFDYKALPGGNKVNIGTVVELAEDWEVHTSRYSAADKVANGDGWTADELDFALVRLKTAVGEEPIGTTSEAGAPNRGWLPLCDSPPSLMANDPLFILQHPQDLDAWPAKLQPQQFAIGTVIGFVGNGLRVRHNTRTLPGSSGSLCLDANLAVVALHHAGEPNNRFDYKGAYNQAIPFTEIIRYFKKHGLVEYLHDCSDDSSNR
jgi:hypothetical protein